MIKKAQNKPQKQLNVGEVLTTEPQSKMKSWGVIQKLSQKSFNFGCTTLFFNLLTGNFNITSHLVQ